MVAGCDGEVEPLNCVVLGEDLAYKLGLGVGRLEVNYVGVGGR